MLLPAALVHPRTMLPGAPKPSVQNDGNAPAADELHI